MTIEYENPWLYKGTNFTTDDINDFFGFVYRITNNKNGREYIDVNTFGSLEPQRVRNAK